MADGTLRLSAEACLQHSVLHSILTLVEPFEETVYSGPLGITFPQELELILGQFIIGGVYGEIEFGSQVLKFLLPLPHCLTVEAFNSSLIYGKGLIGNDEIGTDAQNLTKTFTFRTRSVWIVEVEHQIRGLTKLYPVSHKLTGELMLVDTALVPLLYDTFPVTLIIRRLYTVGKTRNGILGI